MISFFTALNKTKGVKGLESKNTETGGDQRGSASSPPQVHDPSEATPASSRWPSGTVSVSGCSGLTVR